MSMVQITFYCVFSLDYLSPAGDAVGRKIHRSRIPLCLPATHILLGETRHRKTQPRHPETAGSSLQHSLVKSWQQQSLREDSFWGLPSFTSAGCGARGDAGFSAGLGKGTSWKHWAWDPI